MDIDPSPTSTEGLNKKSWTILNWTKGQVGTHLKSLLIIHS